MHIHICLLYNKLYFTIVYISCYTYHYLSREYGKDFTGIVVEDNANSILHMDNHNAQSHSEQQHNIININNKYYINGSNHYNVNLQYDPVISEARNLIKLIYL